MNFTPLDCSPTLLNLSLKKILEAKKVEDTEEYSTLPPTLKDKIRKVLLKRGLSGEQLQHLLHSNVKELDLSDCSKTKSLMTTVLSCRNLRKLHVNSIKNEKEDLSEELKVILQNNKFLSSLFLRNLSSVNDNVLSYLHGNIVELDLGGCHHVTDQGVSSIADHCPLLSSLSLSDTGVTDLGLVTLATGQCRATLTEFYISRCKHVTDEGVQMFLEGLQQGGNTPVLNIFILHKCPLLTSQAQEDIGRFFAENNVKIKQLSWTIN